jgi:hypothetical protein
MLFVFVYVQWCPTYCVVFCFVCLRLVLPLFLDCPFFIALLYSVKFICNSFKSKHIKYITYMFFYATTYVDNRMHRHEMISVLRFTCIYDITYSVSVCLCIMVSNTYCVVFLLCFSSSCAPYDASFSGLSNFDCPFDIL